MDKPDPFLYVRNFYRVPAYKGVRVTVDGKDGVITGSEDAYVLVQFDGDKRPLRCHPTYKIAYHIEANYTCLIQHP